MKTHPGRRGDLVAAFEDMFPVATAEPGTVAYVLVEADDDPDTLYIYEQFTDQDGYDAHMGSEALAAFHTKLADLLVDGAAQSGTVVRSI